MKCWTVDRKLSAYLEGAVSDSERSQLQSHMQHCSSCAVKSQAQRQMRATLRSLPRLAPPPGLTYELRVLASRERGIDRTPASRARRWWSRVKLSMENMMKPIALPAAGGLCAALLLFTSLLPVFNATHLPGGEDVPLSDVPPSRAATLKSVAPIGFQYGDAEVDLRIDGQGRIINYSIVSGPGLEKDALRRSIENNLLFTTFNPATSFGVPINGTLRLSFRSSRIDVKG